LVEILIVIVMISLIALVAIPRFASGSGRRHMESARMRVASALSTARQAAIQKGQTVQFKIQDNRVTVSAGIDSLLPSAPLDTLYKVRVSNVANPFIVTFNSRGFANVGSTKTIRLSRTDVPDDSLMVLITGMVQR
jgi:type II secretory pathway pseudopilin PulG